MQLTVAHIAASSHISLSLSEFQERLCQVMRVVSAVLLAALLPAAIALYSIDFEAQPSYVPAKTIALTFDDGACAALCARDLTCWRCRNRP